MKTIAEFKEKMKLGANVKSKLYRKNGNDYSLEIDYGEREVSVHNTNQFALKTMKGGTITNSWCSWPTKKQFYPISEIEAEIRFEAGKLVYAFKTK